MNGPVQTLAQLVLWRLEIEVLGTIRGWLLVATLVVGDLVFGLSPGETLGALAAGTGVIALVLVARRLVRGPQPTEAEVLYQRSVDVASGRIPR